MKKFLFIFIILLSETLFAKGNGYDVVGIGYYDIKFDGSDTQGAADFRYEKRLY